MINRDVPRGIAGNMKCGEKKTAARAGLKKGEGEMRDAAAPATRG